MTTKTDFHALLELREQYTPETRGFVSKEEEALIKKVLELETRSDIELQNIRDMAVMFYSQLTDHAQDEDHVKEAIQNMDAMSAICCVIDQEKSRRGMEV